MGEQNIRILVVDDEPEVLGTLKRALSKQEFTVTTAESGVEALGILLPDTFDLIVLDVNMPVLNGFEVCERIRSDEAYNNVPILFLTARSQTDDIVHGLDVGGDDYVVKPFELNELLARVRALLRRSERDAMRFNARIQIGSLMLDSDTCTVSVAESDVPVVQLTLTEHRLLRYLMEHNNQALSPDHLLEAVWGYPINSGDPDLVRAHIRNLRAKLNKLNQDKQFVKTIHGVGYMINSMG